jgi:hypothetical protein
MSERRTCPPREILALEQLSVGDRFHFAYRVVNTPPTESAPSWVVTEITDDCYKVRLTQRSVVLQNNEPGAIEMKVPKSTMVARCDKVLTNPEPGSVGNP